MSQDDTDGWSKRARIALIVLGIFIGAVAAPAIYAQVQTTEDYHMGEGMIIGSPSGLQVELGQNLTNDRQHLSPSDDAVDLRPVRFEADGSAYVNVSDWDGSYLELEDLDASSNALRVRPTGSHSDVTIDGAASRVKVGAVAVDDGTDDVRVTTGGSTTLQVWGLPAEDTVIAVDGDTGDRIQTFQTDGEGAGTFTLSQSRDVQFQSAQAPTISNPQPADGATVSNYSTTLSVDVSDPDFEGVGDSVTVTFYDTDAGTQIHQETISSEQTVSTDWSGLDMGDNRWNVTAVDSDGNRVALGPLTVRAPKQLEIRDEETLNLITNAGANVTVTLFPEESGDTIVERTTDDGTVNLTGVPVDQPIIVRASADGYYTRTVVIEDIAAQQTVYLLDENATAVESRFILEDLTGQYPGESTLYISKPITDGSTVEYRTIHADQFGVDGVTANLLEGQRYRLRIESPSGTVQDLGPYRAATSETVTIQPGTAEIDLSEGEGGWQSGATLTNQTIYASYEDPANLTDTVTMTVYERGNRSNQLAASETYHDLGSVSTKWTLTANQSEEEWVVVMDVERNGTTVTVEHVVGANPEGVIEGLSGHWRALFGVVAIFLFGGIFSVLNRAVGAVMVSLVGGILWWVGWLAGATAGVAVVIYMFVAFTYAIYVASR